MLTIFRLFLNERIYLAWLEEVVVEVEVAHHEAEEVDSDEVAEVEVVIHLEEEGKPIVIS